MNANDIRKWAYGTTAERFPCGANIIEHLRGSPYRYVLVPRGPHSPYSSHRSWQLSAIEDKDEEEKVKVPMPSAPRQRRQPRNLPEYDIGPTHIDI